ncbi:TPA: amidohydrolase family protein, partial [Escherichia coli]
QVISGHWGEMLPFWLQRLDDSLPLAATGLSRTLTRTFQEHVYVTPSYANTAALPVYLRVNGC